MAQHVVAVASSAEECDCEYDEALSDVNIDSVIVAWRHYRTANSAAIALYGLPLGNDGVDYANDIPLQTPEETLAFDLLQRRFDTLCRNNIAFMRVSTTKGTVLIIKALHRREKFLISVAPDISPLGEIIYYSIPTETV